MGFPNLLNFPVFSSLLLAHSCIVLGNSTIYDSYSLDKSWPNFDKHSFNVNKFGSAIGIDLQNSSNLIIFHRGKLLEVSKENEYINEDVVLILNSLSGKVIGQWGRNMFVKPHGLRVSDKGDLFVTDVKLHQVFKFKKSTKNYALWETVPELILGEKFVPGNDPYHFCSPAGVAVLPKTNDFFVADGYCNSRIVQFNNAGSYIGEFGAGSPNPSLSPVIPFNVPHAVTASLPLTGETTNEQKDVLLPPLLFVADRNNGRVQCFLMENKTFLYEINPEMFGIDKGMIFSLSMTAPSSTYPYGVLYLVNGNLSIGKPRLFQIVANNSGFKIINSFPVSKDEIGLSDSGQIENPHDIAVSSDGSYVYVIEAYKILTIKKFIGRDAEQVATVSGTAPFSKSSQFLINSFAIIMTVAMMQDCK